LSCHISSYLILSYSMYLFNITKDTLFVLVTRAYYFMLEVSIVNFCVQVLWLLLFTLYGYWASFTFVYAVMCHVLVLLLVGLVLKQLSSKLAQIGCTHNAANSMDALVQPVHAAWIKDILSPI